MGLNYKKRIKVAPGVHVNLGKKSAGISIGGKYGGVSMNSRTGTTVHTSAPGTGLSYREHLSSSNSKRHAASQVEDVYDDCEDTSESTVDLSTPPLFLDADVVASLNDKAFLAYSKDVLAYCKAVSDVGLGVDKEIFERAQNALHTVRQEQIRRADKKTAAKSKKEKAPKPKKESKLSTLEPEKKAKVNKISVLGIAAGIVFGVVCAALQAENIAILFGALLIVSLYIFAKTK